MPKIINTDKSKCVACNKCIMVCPIKYANNVEIIDGERKIEIEHKHCIACGRCLEVCDHNARYYVDDTQRFFQDLEKGKKISVIAAPSFSLDRNIKHKKFFAYLKSLGVNLIYDVSFGADITSWAYVKYINQNEPNSWISQPCPAIVNYIEKYATELIDNLIPVSSPAINTAKYIKKYLNNNDDIAFVSPCMAKKDEFVDNDPGYISYNITFNQLRRYLENNNIDISHYEDVDFDNNQVGLGSQYSRPGGLKENLLYHLPDLNIKQVEGSDKAYNFINILKDKEYLAQYDFIDILNCEDGCNLGTGTCRREYKNSIEKEKAKEKYLNKQNEKYIPNEDYQKIFNLFDEQLNINDFLTSYQHQKETITTIEPSFEELEQAYELLHKLDEDSKKINCYSCGYKTCKDMAVAIHNNYNIPSSCYQFTKKELEIKQDSLKDKNKELNSLVSNLNELTEEKTENEKYIRTILEHLAESVIVTNRDGLIDFVNNETTKIFSYENKDCIGKYIQELIPSLNIEKISYEEIYKEELEVINPHDNQPLILKIECTPLKVKDNELLVFIIDDITREKELNNMKNQFVSMISHELRTPLTSIRGALGVVSSGTLGSMPSKASELLNIASNNCVRLVNLINDILDLEKIKAGKMNFNFAEYKIMPLIEETLLMNQEYAKQYNVKYEITEKIENAIVNIDKDRFIQVLTNLLSNAAKFSNKNETVNIYVQRDRGSIKVSVQDKGMGIPKEQYSKIFESFSQVDSSDTRQKGGTGLGLTITKSIVTRMGGRIAFKSKLDKGTTFYFSFPEIIKNNKLPKALVVEDDYATALYIKKSLKNFGYEVDIAVNAMNAEAFLAEKNYALMTLDLVLPDKHGFDLLTEIRNNPATENLPVVIVSASCKNDYDGEFEDEVLDWIEKDFDQSKFKKVIKNILQQQNKDKVKVLHVEDDEDIMEIVSSCLGDWASIKKTTSLEKAKEALLLYKFDLIILDYKLPDGTCEGIIEELKKSSSKDASVVVFSAYETSKILTEHVDSVMLKTNVSNEEFINSIKSLIKNKQDNTLA